MDTNLKILMLEDMEEDAGLIARALQKENLKFIHERVDTQEEFTEALETFKPDIILSDHAMPQFNSIEALKICKQKKFNGPFILVTGAVSDEFAVMCIKNGADDYLLKSNLSRLPVAIRSALAQRQQEVIRLDQQEKLRKQNDELIKINKELDTFVYSVSHNLRAPLASILGLVNVARLEGKKSTETIDLYCNMIERSVVKLDETIKDILDYSQNVRIDPTYVEIDLESIIENSFEQLGHLGGYSSIKKIIDIQKTENLYSDELRIKIILHNLISNSIKYKDTNNPEHIVQINAKISPTRAKIEVIDNGMGIAEEYLPHIFKMFYRATETGEGSGLGLYIVKEMVNKLQGEIDIQSKPSEGTTVTIIIPNYVKPG
jgi:signal transduction histidine kinase